MQAKTAIFEFGLFEHQRASTLQLKICLAIFTRTPWGCEKGQVCMILCSNAVRHLDCKRNWGVPEGFFGFKLKRWEERQEPPKTKKQAKRLGPVVWRQKLDENRKRGCGNGKNPAEFPRPFFHPDTGFAETNLCRGVSPRLSNAHDVALFENRVASSNGLDVNAKPSPSPRWNAN